MNIYQYEDYRQYLGDRHKEEKNDPSFACRIFALRAGFPNTRFLDEVIRGKRNLSKSSMEKIIKIFSLLPYEADFFRLLVAFSHAKELKKKDLLYKKIIYRRKRSAFAKLNPELEGYYRDFRYTLIRSALMVLDFYGDYKELAEFIIPRLSITSVRKCVKDLLAWKLIKKDDTGRYVVTRKFIEPAETLSAQNREMNREWIRQAEAALVNLDADERNISSMLVNVSTEVRDNINLKIEQFQQEVWDLVRNDQKKAECLMLLNTQYLPKSQVKEKK